MAPVLAVTHLLATLNFSLTVSEEEEEAPRKSLRKRTERAPLVEGEFV
jgi:hypothetical protein